MNIKIIYEDENLLVVDKPAEIVVFPEGAAYAKATASQKTLIDYLVEENPELKDAGEAPRYGVAHRLDKDTSGVLLVAKSSESLIFLQKQFKNREVEKKYIALVCGRVKDNGGKIETLIGRSPQDPRKQKAYPLDEPNTTGKREAITEYKVLERFENFTLLEVEIKTGRKHQIRCHMAYIHHPVAGDRVYGFKDSPVPDGLNRQFMHASYLKIKLPASPAGGENGETEEFRSDLPEELKNILEKIKI